VQPLDSDYKVFIHLLDGNRQIQGQCDAMPDSGEALTSGWQPRDVLADHYEIPLQRSAAAGTLQIEVGFYDPVTGERLSLLRDGAPTGEDKLILPDTITVR